MASYQSGFSSSATSLLHCLKILPLLLILASSSVLAEGILIFSSTHNNDGPTLLTQAEGVLKVEVTTFNPIISLKVNQEEQVPQSPTRASLSIPYRITTGTKQVKIEVRTEKTEASRTFRLRYSPVKGSGETGQKEPFLLLGGLGFLATDNATKVKSDKKAGQKLLLILLPTIRFSLDGQKFEAKGTLLREKFLDSDLATAELVYTKLEGSWLNQANAVDWNLVLGVYDTGSQSNSFSAENEVEKGFFVQGRFKLKALANKNLEMVIGYALKDQPDQLTKDYDGDGSATQLEGVFKKKFGKIKGKFQGSLLSNDAKGKYKDYSRVKFSVYGEIPLSGALSVGGSFQYKMMAYSQLDPVKGDKELSTSNTIILGGKRIFKQIGGLVLVGALQMQNKNSNIEALSFSESSIGVTAIYKF